MGALKPVVIIALALCIAATACSHKEDTESTAVWLDSADLKPATSPWQPSAVPPECDDIISSRSEAARMLRSQPVCIDAAVAALERFAVIDPAALSDLAAAYALRAQREDRPADLLNALDAAQHAVAALPQSAVARFNRALIEESLGLSAEAINSWNQFLQNSHSPRTAEARNDRDRLLHRTDPTAQWARNQAQLPAALRAHDRALILRLISPYPSSAERYLEEELLKKEHLGEAKTLATALAQLTNDRFALDVVEAMERSPDAFQEAHRAFVDARRADRAIAANRGSLYENAMRLLDRVGSPLSLPARLGYAVVVSLDKSKPNAYVYAYVLLDPIELEARKKRYGHLLARIRSTRANFLFRQGRYVESLAESDRALAEYERMGDIEDVADTRARRIGVFREAGQNELSWRESMQVIQAESHMAETRTRHVFLGDTAKTALALGHAPIALLYQNTAVRLIQRDLAAAPPERSDIIKGLQKHLSVVLRERASLELQLEHYSRAAADLEESFRLLGKDIDRSAGRIFQVRMNERKVSPFCASTRHTLHAHSQTRWRWQALNFGRTAHHFWHSEPKPSGGLASPLMQRTT
jgi:tetratricopeptide (TPR) repeat protein